MHKSSAALAVLAMLAVVPIGAEPNLTKQDADRFEQKLGKIVLQGKTAAVKKPTQEHATPITDNELNSYFKYNGKAQVPVGVVDPTINAVGDGRVTGRAVVDLDVVRNQKQRGWLDPINYLSGRLPVTAAGRLTTKDGRGQFQLESAEIKGITVPKAVLQELLSFYSKTPENPAGIDMDAPFELPAAIREIRVGAGTSTVIQ